MEYAARKGHANVIRVLAELGVRAEGALLGASRLGDEATVTELLKTHRTYINCRGGPDGVYTPLLEAARCGHVDSFAKLLSEGADPNAVAAHTKLTALHLAARIGQRAIVRLLITAQVPLASIDEQGYSALHYAAEGGFEEIVSMIIAANDSETLPRKSGVSRGLLINGPTRDLDTPLHLAASNGHLKTVETLLANDAKTWIPNDRKYTPLHCATEGGFQLVVRKLLSTVMENQEKRSMMEIQLLPGEAARIPSLVELAVKNGHLGTMTELRNSGFYDNSKILSSALPTACHAGKDHCAFYILQWYNEVYSAGEPLRDVGGNTALHLAARHGNVRLFQKIMDSKYVPIDSLNKSKLKPLHIAAYFGRLAIIQLFKDGSALGGTTADGTWGTLLDMAAEAGYLDIVKWLLDYKLLKKDTVRAVEDTRAVMNAALEGHEPIVKLLLDSKYAAPTGNLLRIAVLKGWKDIPKLVASIDASVLNWMDDNTGNTALHLAVEREDPDMVEALLAVKADPNLKNKKGRLPIAMAVETDNLHIVTALLDGAPTLDVDQLDMDGLTPLLRACKMALKGKNDTAKLVWELLSKRGADINLNAKLLNSHLGYAGMTPLHLSALLLLEADGSKEDIIDEEDNIVSHAESPEGEKNSEDIVEDNDHTDSHAKSSEEGKKSDERAKDELQEESDELHDELLKLLLDFGADPNERDATGSTPLMLAAGAGHIKALGALLDHNADPNISNTRGSTALHGAAKCGHVACINLLVKKGANMNAVKLDNYADRGFWGFTPLVLAITERQLSAVKALLRLGADIGRAVHVAALCGKLDMFKTVHGKCPDPNIFDSGLGTPLCLAVTAKSKDVALCLLENPNVATSIASPIGQTPLAIAAILGKYDIAKSLVEKGADPNKRDHQGRTPLDYAILSKNKQLAKFLCQHTRLGFPLDGVRGHSPLYLACRMSDDDIFNEINDACKKLQPDEYLKLCELAIHAAIMSGNNGRLTTLLNTPGITATVADDDGWTPLQCARCYGREEMEKQILGAGATDESLGEMKRPTQWHLDDRHAALSPRTRIGAEQAPGVRDAKIVEIFTIMGDHMRIIGTDGVAVARANHCIPGGQDFYFEIKLQKCYKEGDQKLGIGLCSDIAPLDCMLGFGNQNISCGYHADDGAVYASGMRSTTRLFKKKKYGQGDTVGCGVDADKGIIYFTKGGQRLEDAVHRPPGKLYPAVFFNTREIGVSISLERMSRRFGTREVKVEDVNTTSVPM